jgi:hypothetical protein
LKISEVAMPEQEFTIKDRRRFTAEGEPRPEDLEAETGTEAEEQPAAKDAAETERPEPKAGEDECPQRPPLPEINFSAFVISLGTSALISLGELPEPGVEKPCQNLPLAKQTIDILGMINQKTQGNLTEDEGALLSNLLYELRLRYVAVTRK